MKSNDPSSAATASIHAGAPHRGPRLTAGPLTVGQAAAGFVLTVLCALVPPILVGSMLTGTDGKDQSYLALPVQFFLMFLTGALLIRLWRGRSFRSSDLGLTFPRDRGPWILAGLGGIAFVLLATGAGWLLSTLNDAGTKVASQVGMGESLGRDLVMVTALAIAAPVGEEMLYRGVIFRGLHDAFARSGRAWLRRTAFWVPAMTSSVLFAIAHGGEGQSTQVVFLAIFGLIAAGIYWWTGSLVMAVFAHSVTNAINGALLATGAGGFSSPLVWVLVIVAPLIAVGLMWLVRATLGRAR